MDDPYKVLGLKKNATDEEIKAAYHELVKKYHPDKYQNNPLSDLAEEKLREVNEAYDLLMRPGSASSSYNSSGYGYDHGQGAYNNSYNNYSYSNAQNSAHYDVRAALDRNQLERAEQLLYYSTGNRDAEWYFLSGILSYKRGYVDDALNKIGYAMSIEPNNVEFRSVYSQIRNTGAIYQTTSTDRGYSSSNLCSDLIMCYCCSSFLSPCW